jgi:hypothetical protein
VSDAEKLAALIDNPEFITDAARFAEGVLTEAQIRRKYRHLTEADWDRLGTDEELIASIELTKLARIRAGTSTREKAQLLHTKAPDVLSEIMTGDAAPRHKIESARALGQIATPVATPASPPSAEKFSIIINIGGDVPPLVFNKSLALGPEADDTNNAPQELLTTNKREDDIKSDAEDDQLHTPWGLIASKRTEDGGGESL